MKSSSITGKPDSHNQPQVQSNQKHSLSLWAVDTLIFIKWSKPVKVIEELIRTLHQGVLSIQDSFEENKNTYPLLKLY